LFFNPSDLNTTQYFQPVFASTQPVFYPGCGSANIDGNVDPNEWAAADSLLLPMANADTPLDGTFYVMQS